MMGLGGLIVGILVFLLVFIAGMVGLSFVEGGWLLKTVAAFAWFVVSAGCGAAAGFIGLKTLDKMP